MVSTRDSTSIKHDVSSDIRTSVADTFFPLYDRRERHTNVMFPGHNHASLYDTRRIHDDVLYYLRNQGVAVVFQSRITDARIKAGSVVNIEDTKKTYATAMHSLMPPEPPAPCATVQFTAGAVPCASSDVRVSAIESALHRLQASGKKHTSEPMAESAP